MSTTLPLADFDRRPTTPAIVSFAEYVAILRRRRWLILRTFAIVLLAGVFVTMHAKPIYEGTARLLVDPAGNGVANVDSGNPLSPLFAPKQPQPIDTQVELVETMPVMQRAADSLRLPVDDVDGALSISEINSTNLIAVTAQSTDPKEAADIANAVVSAYLDEEHSQSLTEINRAKLFVESKVDAARSQLQSSSQALAAFERKENVPALDRNRDDQIGLVTSLTSQIQQTAPDLAAAQAEAEHDRKLLLDQPAAILTPLPATNPAIAPLQTQITQLQVQRASLTQPGGFTAQAPQIRAIDGQIAELRGRIAKLPQLTITQVSSPNAARDELRSKLVSAEASEAPLRSRLQSLKSQLANEQNATAKYAALGIDSDRLTQDYQSAVAAEKMYSDQLLNLTLREQAQHAPAQIADLAVVPDTPIKPNKPQAVFFCAVMGLILGICLALATEFLDDRLYTVEDAERTVCIASLGRIPRLPLDQPGLLTGMNPLSPFAESFRLLRTNLQFAGVDAPIRTLLVTSASAGEGKTTVAANLAFSMALTGRTVALVDANLRRPGVHRLLDLPAVPGLTNVLLGETSLADSLLENVERPGVMTLPCGSAPPNPGELLGSERFKSVLHELTNMVDIVIIDSPPLLAGADAQVLAAQCDGVLLVMLPGQTRKSAAKLMMDQLHQVRASVIGVAYNQIEMPPMLAYAQSEALGSETPVARLESPASDSADSSESEEGWRVVTPVAAAGPKGRE